MDSKPTEDVEDLLEDIHQHITRLSMPYGSDEYFVIVTRLDAIPGEKNGVDPEKPDDSLSLRRALITAEVGGDCWRDWKRGDMKGNFPKVRHPQGVLPKDYSVLGGY